MGVRNFWLNFWLRCLSAFIVFFLFEKYKNVIYKSLAKPWFEFRWTHLTIFLRLRKNELAKVEINGKPMAKPSVSLTFCQKWKNLLLQVAAVSQNCHCVKFPNTEFFLVRIFLYSDWIRKFTVNLRIQSECKKIRTRKNSVFGHFSRSASRSKLETNWLSTNVIKQIFMVSSRGMLVNNRSSYQRCAIKKAVLKIFSIFTRKHLRWILFSI